MVTIGSFKNASGGRGDSSLVLNTHLLQTVDEKLSSTKMSVWSDPHEHQYSSLWRGHCMLRCSTPCQERALTSWAIQATFLLQGLV